MIVCGDSGGRRADGEPCQRRVSGERPRCPQHPVEGEPAPAGRPKIEFSDSDIRRVEQLAGLGLTQEEIGEVLEVPERTLSRRISDTPEISAAYARGRAKAKARAAGRYHQIAFGRAAGLGLPEGETVSIGEQRRALRHILESGLVYKDVRHLEHSGEIDTGGDVHVYLPENGRDELPEPIRRRAEAVSGNGKP